MADKYLQEEDDAGYYELEDASGDYELEAAQQGAAPGGGGGGSGVSSIRVEIVQQAAITAGGPTQDFTFPGAGTCKGAMFFVTKGITNGSATDSALFSVGACDGTNQYAHGLFSSDNVGTSVCDRRGATDECIIALLAEGSINGEAAFDSFITDGVRINWGDFTGTALLITAHLFFDNGSDLQFHVGTATGDATSGNTVSVEGPAFLPDMVLASTHNAAFNDAASVGASISFGVACRRTPIKQSSHALFALDDADTSEIAGIVNDDRLVSTTDESAETASLELTAFDALGFDVTTRDASTAIPFGYVALAFNGKCKYWCGVEDSPGATGDWTVSSPGFKPQFVGAATGRITTLNSFASNASAGAFGISSFTATDENSVTIADYDNQGTTDTQSLVNSLAIHDTTDSGNNSHVSSAVAPPTMNSGGWTVNFPTTISASIRKWPMWAIEAATPAPTPPPGTGVMLDNPFGPGIGMRPG